MEGQHEKAPLGAGMAPSWQPAKTWELQTYSHEELASVNNLGELGRLESPDMVQAVRPRAKNPAGSTQTSTLQSYELINGDH